jgi:hypothetical protein
MDGSDRERRDSVLVEAELRPGKPGALLGDTWDP